MFVGKPRRWLTLPLSTAALAMVAACGASSGGGDGSSAVTNTAVVGTADATATEAQPSDAGPTDAEPTEVGPTVGQPTSGEPPLGEPPGAVVGSAATAIPTGPTVGPRSVLTGQGVIRQLDDDPPVLCLGPVAQSYPPQCSGPLIFGLDWTEMPDYRDVQGVRWGEARVVGTYDGQAFTLIRPPIRSRYPFEPDLAMGAPEADQLCDDPFEGSEADFDGLSVEASRARDDVAATLEASQSYVSSFSTNGKSVLNVVLVQGADVADMQTWVRKVWPGGLCIETRDAPPRATVNQALDAMSRADLPGVFSWSAANEGGLQVKVLLADEDTINGIDQVVSGFLDPSDVDIQGALIPLDFSG